MEAVWSLLRLCNSGTHSEGLHTLWSEASALFFLFSCFGPEWNSKVQEFQRKNTPYKLGWDQNWKEEGQRKPSFPYWHQRWGTCGVTLGKRIHQLNKESIRDSPPENGPSLHNSQWAHQAGAMRLASGVWLPRPEDTSSSFTVFPPKIKTGHFFSPQKRRPRVLQGKPTWLQE